MTDVCGYDKTALNTILEEHAEEARKQFQRAEAAAEQALKAAQVNPNCGYGIGDKPACGTCVWCRLGDAEQRLAAQQWQPIATAPRDGTEILLLCGGTISQARWKKGISGDFFWGNEGWHYASWRQPTHWMPLPAPPEAAQ